MAAWMLLLPNSTQRHQTITDHLTTCFKAAAHNLAYRKGAQVDVHLEHVDGAVLRVSIVHSFVQKLIHEREVIPNRFLQ